ncbi:MULTISPECIES: cobyrinate a,c-diamide synthase [unclassified Microcoleus]|uniref:cobyrinate a,c-diamide synthase n=1 Tax=unclassified Microcoleus TaxID=2642155 RepID=UPI001D66FA9C|nr:MULTISPECIES: cobyrinate a,c-diamide synthase [unclassified Microcoleus]MCC3443926.1 cobyrinate a,c-diamide synthase [Microcoleus sp. PH2017_03_ELD_O_A]MCC3468127.1 cobyrinate a,c-diamide synthase [Microcoleus sp. PH2017_06_SFM_O_A]MCC3501959.1 cobyrinate a,c-diamide synthase [Microcoleus sp. PH2017_19_SFW_U_A]TAE45175.1 MAG: cobyrinate a,c-diamide synthase [Oscillatoriales cyanobacterium]MCC3411540.1 cobyrinate a,c-diamide synthase [Microcoleus sp. PH2017_02_FOX_O_A]
MALVIAGERSGAGKTTVTIALLAYLIRQGLNVQSFKVGPDYIDPMFHAFVTGRPCRNLDPVLTSESYVKKCFSRHIQDVDCALVEGVMGLFDGVSPKKEEGRRKREEGREKREEEQNYPISFASTAHVAYLLNLPILFVIDCSRLSGSVAAIAHGFRSFNPNLKFAGLVLNRVASDRHLDLLTDALEPLNLPILGVLRRDEAVTIPDRHLGLIPAEELPHLHGAIDKLADLAAVSFDWEQLLPLLAATPHGGGEGSEQLLGRYSLPYSIVTKKDDVVNCLEKKFSVRIAVARDRAFNFYYQDNLDLLEELGAELVFWSPLDDSVFPENVQGLYFGGGFPEVFAGELSGNVLIRDAVRSAIFSGMPTYAECGGLMYLCDSIVDFDGNSWQGVGVLPAVAAMGKRLTLGYREAVAVGDSLVLTAGDVVWGHEFHRSHLTVEPTNPIYHSWRYGKRGEVEAVAEGWGVYGVHAAYLHLHWGANPDIAVRFLQQCSNFDCKGVLGDRVN